MTWGQPYALSQEVRIEVRHWNGREPGCVFAILTFCWLQSRQPGLPVSLRPEAACAPEKRQFFHIAAAWKFSAASGPPLSAGTWGGEEGCTDRCRCLGDTQRAVLNLGMHACSQQQWSLA